MSANVSMRDALYEAPGPKTQRLVRIGTAISVVLLVAFVAFVLRQFYVNDQLNPKYWSFFLRWTTWRFLLRGFLGTIKVAITAGIIAMALGLLLMLGRISPNRALSAVCHVITDLFRSLPSLLLIYFFFLVIPKYGLRMPAFWMITVPVALAASGVLAEVFRAGVNAVPKGQVEAAMALGMTHGKITRKIEGHHGGLRGQLPRPHAERAGAHLQLRRARLHVLRGGAALHRRQLRNQPVLHLPRASLGHAGDFARRRESRVRS